MANMRITTTDRKTLEVNGHMTFRAEKIINEEGDEDIIITGEMQTHRYIESIDKIETHRYIVLGIDVLRETFGTDDFSVLYEFKANDYMVKNGETNLSAKQIVEIETKLCRNSDADLWEGGE